jgi:hypothetical protein
MAHTDIPNALEKIKAREKDVPWYNPDIGDKLGSSARELLESYSKIPAGEVEDHVYKIVNSQQQLFERSNANWWLQRDEAWAIWPYPCIGGFRFLDLYVLKNKQSSPRFQL